MRVRVYVVPVRLCKCSTCFELNGCCFYISIAVPCSGIASPRMPSNHSYSLTLKHSDSHELFVYCCCILDFMNNSFANACKVIVCTAHTKSQRIQWLTTLFSTAAVVVGISIRSMMQMMCTCNMHSQTRFWKSFVPNICFAFFSPSSVLCSVCMVFCAPLTLYIVVCFVFIPFCLKFSCRFSSLLNLEQAVWNVFMVLFLFALCIRRD